MMNQECIAEWQAKFGYGFLKKLCAPAFKRVLPQLHQ